jgi:hypothetical protein
MDFLTTVLGGLLSGSAVLGAGVYLFQTSFTRILDKRMEVFKQQLQVGTKLRELTLKSQIEFRERQLGEFYGPIYAILKRGVPLYKHYEKNKINRILPAINEIFVDGNSTIVKIILQKAHLIVGDDIPGSYIKFLVHVAVWSAFRATPSGEVPPEKEFPEAYYPKDFEEDIFRTTKQLKQELADLHARYGVLAVKD